MKVLYEIFLIVIFTAASNSIVCSQPLDSTPSINNESSTEGRGTEQKPLVVKNLQIEKTKEELDQERKDRENKETYEWRTLNIALAGAIISLAIAVITFSQLFLFRRQLISMNSATMHAGIAANAAKVSADFAHQEFISTHRPRVIIRRVFVSRDSNEDLLVINYEVVNIGDTKAKIIESSEYAWYPEITESLPKIPPYNGSNIQSITLESGESWILYHARFGEFATDFDAQVSFSKTKTPNGHMTINGPGMMFLGYIIYEDTFNRRRRTAFLRQYNLTTERFDTILHADYEYQD